MQVNETLNEGLKRGYTLFLSAKDLDDLVEAKLKDAQPQIEIKGFRKGKVPLPLLKKRYGDGLMGEVMQESIDGAIAEQLKKTGDQPAAQPSVKVTNEQWKPGDDLNVDVEYEALPEIPELDFKDISLEKLTLSAEDKDIDEAIGKLAETAQDFKDRKKGSKAKDGDQVVFDFVGKVDGEAFEGGSAEDYPLVLGSGSFIPGFEEQLVGVKADDETDINVTFPEDYGAENLKGKEAVFSCKIKAVKQPVAPEINDELAKKFGVDDLSALRTQIADRLVNEYAQAARGVQKRSLLDELAKRVDFELPQSLVTSEADEIAHQLWHEDNPDVTTHDHDKVEPTQEHVELAQRRVRLGLLMSEIGKKAEITVSDAEMSQAVMSQARQYPGQEREFFEFVQKNAQVQQSIRAPLFEDKVVDYIFELATVTEKKVSKDELQKAIEALDSE